MKIDPLKIIGARLTEKTRLLNTLQKDKRGSFIRVGFADKMPEALGYIRRFIPSYCYAVYSERNEASPGGCVIKIRKRKRINKPQSIKIPINTTKS